MLVRSEVLGIAAQMIQAPVLEPAATAVGATVGAGIGSTVPVVGSAVGAFTGAVQASSALSNFKVTAGNLYDEAYLSQPEDVKSKINQRDAYAISMIAGMVSGGIEFLPAGKLFKKAFKGINLTKVAWAEVIKEGAASNTGKASGLMFGFCLGIALSDTSSFKSNLLNDETLLSLERLRSGISGSCISLLETFADCIGERLLTGEARGLLPLL